MTWEAPVRPHVEDRIERLLRSSVGGLLARPWWDRAALWMLARWYFPLSRMWAAARAADGDPERFFAEVPTEPIPALYGRLEALLAQFEVRRAEVSAGEAAWREAFFGSNGVTPERLAAIEAGRLDRRNAYNTMRRHFAIVGSRREVHGVRWAVPTPNDVEELYGAELADPGAAFAPPATMPTVERSKSFQTAVGVNYWLRFGAPTARMGDMVIARVYEPEGAKDPPTLIFGHGVCVEFDHWHGLVDEVAEMVRMGIRVVRPEAPWHGRRVPDGRYGGEQFIASPPLGALDLFHAEIKEWAVLMDWCRAHSSGPVAVGGSSLGALLSQLICDKSRHWPARLQPDAALLITHCGKHHDAAQRGALARVWGMADATAARGWTPELIARYLPLLDPGDDPPVVPPENIVTVLGRYDDVTPFDSGMRIVGAWGIPEENTFIWPRGHFSVPIGLMYDRAPLRRFREILTRLA